MIGETLHISCKHLSVLYSEMDKINVIAVVLATLVILVSLSTLSFDQYASAVKPVAEMTSVVNSYNIPIKKTDQ